MPEITTFNDAVTRLQTLFPSLQGSMRSDCAKIAVFLSSTTVFEQALKDLSERLWQLYRLKARSPDEAWAKVRDGSERNKFTGSMAIEGRHHGFGFAENGKIDTTRVILVGAIDGADYLARVKSGLFFKDMMDLKHGEHTHTLQWLAIARNKAEIGLENSASHLYKNMFEYEAKQPIVCPGFKQKPAVGGEVPLKRVSLWSWLVDCFPTSSATGGVLPASESIFSSGYRCPQNVMKHLLDLQDDTHFLANYLQFRYQRRNFFRPNEKGYDAVSGGATSKNYGSAKQEKIPGGKKIGDGGFEFAERRAPIPADELAKKKFKVVKFHGLEGTLTDPAQA